MKGGARLVIRGRVDWDYEPAGDQDYMEKFLFIIAEPYIDHQDFQPDWRQ